MQKNKILTRGLLLIGTLAAGCASILPAQAGVDGPPRLDTSVPNTPPPYPDAAQNNGEEGTILVDVYVRSSGKALRAKVSKSSGFDDLDTAAVQGVLNWHYLPAMRDGDTVSDWTTVKVVYQLPRFVPAANSPQPNSTQRN